MHAAVTLRKTSSLRSAASAIAAVLLSAVAMGCGDGSGSGASTAPADVVRESIAALQPAANLGHRGSGINTAENPYAENSIASFRKGMDEGADGIELDVELTSDLKLLVLHDDTLDRTTDCTGCLNAMTFDEARRCRLRDGTGRLTDEPLPTLREVYSALPRRALVNVELKVYEGNCLIPATAAEVLGRIAAEEIATLKVADRTVFSSFDPDALTAVEEYNPEFYTGYLFTGLRRPNLDTALARGFDAIHPGGVFPFVMVSPALIADAQANGLQVNVWTVDDPASIDAMIAAGADSIITNEPDVVAEQTAAE